MTKTKQRRRLARFKLSEMSIVDNPAQEGALITLTKRQDELELFNKWMGAGAIIEDDDAEHPTLSLKGKRRKFFKQAEPAKPVLKIPLPTATPEEIAANTKAGVEALVRQTEKLKAYIDGKDTSMSKTDDDPKATFAKARQDFNKRVEEIRARDKCRHTVAMSKARVEFPEEFEAYQQANIEANSVSKADDRPVPNKDHATFMQKVAEIAQLNKIPRSQAMAKARSLYPEEFAKAYSFE